MSKAEYNIFLKNTKLWDNYKSCNICILGIPKRDERENVTQEILEFLQINVSHQTTDSVNSVNTNQDTCHRNNTLAYYFQTIESQRYMKSP